MAILGLDGPVACEVFLAVAAVHGRGAEAAAVAEDGVWGPPVPIEYSFHDYRVLFLCKAALPSFPRRRNRLASPAQ